MSIIVKKNDKIRGSKSSLTPYFIAKITPEILDCPRIYFDLYKIASSTSNFTTP